MRNLDEGNYPGIRAFYPVQVAVNQVMSEGVVPGARRSEAGPAAQF